MTDYQIQGSTRRCAATGRELVAGERFFGVLVDEGTRFVRRDYSPEGWAGPPERAFSFWQGKVQPPGTPRKPPIDDGLLLDCLARLGDETEPAKLAFRFVLTLLLLRRKKLRLEDTRREGGREVLVVREAARGGARHQVIDPGLPDGEMESVQDEVFRVLGWA